MFLPVDRPLVVVFGADLLHAAETASVVDGSHLTPADEWRTSCGTPATRLALVRHAPGREPFVPAWPPDEDTQHRYGDACPTCTRLTLAKGKRP